MQKSIKSNGKNKKSSKRMTITFKGELYKKISQLQHKTHIKSYSLAVNILLNDEVDNHPHYDASIQNEFIKVLSQLNKKIGKLNQNISGACNNLNQIAYNLNIKKRQNNKINRTTFMAKNGLTIMQNLQKLQGQKMKFKQIRKEVNQIWQLLE